MAAISELCAAMEACLAFFHSPPDGEAASRRGRRLHQRISEAEEALRMSQPRHWDDEARLRFCRLLGELGGAMAAVASSPATHAAFTFEPGGGGSPAHVLAGCQLNTACAVIKACSRVAAKHAIAGGSDAFRWAQSWRMLAEVERRRLQGGLAIASQPLAAQQRLSAAAHSSASAALLGAGGTHQMLMSLNSQSFLTLEAAQALLCMLRLPGNERTLAAFAGTIAASADTLLLLAITSTALALCLQQGIMSDGLTMFYEWADVYGSLLADPPFARVQALMQAQPHMQAAVAGLLLHALPSIWEELEAGRCVGISQAYVPGHFASRLLQLVGAPCLHAGLRQALSQCSGSSGHAAVEALAHVVGFAAQGSSSNPAEAVCAWGQLCAALAQSGPGAGSPLQRHASLHSIMVLPLLVALAAVLQKAPAGGEQGNADATTAAADRVLSSLAAAALSAANCDGNEEQASPLCSDSMADAATAALKLLHLAAERQAVAASAGGGSGALPGLSALVDAGAAAAVSCLGNIGMADMVYDEVEQGAASEQVEHDVAQRLWLLHSTACRFLHYALGRLAELAPVLPDRADIGWEGFVAGLTSLVTALVRFGKDFWGREEEEGEEERPQAAVHNRHAASARAMQAIAVAHAEAMSAVLAAVESGSSNVPCEGQPADDLCCHVAEGIARAALIAAAVTSPGCPNLVGGSAAAVGSLRSALERALRFKDDTAAFAWVPAGQVAADAGSNVLWLAQHSAISSCIDAAGDCPQLAAALLTSGLLGKVVEAALGPHFSGNRQVQGDLNKQSAIVLGLVQACREAAGSGTQGDAAVGGENSTAGMHSAPLGVPATVLCAAEDAVSLEPLLQPTAILNATDIIQSRLAAISYHRDTVQPSIQPLGEALDAFYQQPEQQQAAQLAKAQAAAARSCAYLRCASVAATGGPAAGEQPGSKRCGGCRVVRYCDAACSAADWRAGHRRMCKQLAAARLEEKQSASAAAAAASAFPNEAE